MYNPSTPLPPGFRFHPTDEELIVHYLRNQTSAPPTSHNSIISHVDIYKFDPWDLPEKALFGDREWYFFSPRDRKYPNGLRPNRAAVSGYWKATGTDKAVVSAGNNVGVKKALVFYKGKPPKGLKTSWIMHEYRLAESHNSNNYRSMNMRFTEHSMRLDDWVLCRIYNKRKQIQPQINDQEHEYSCQDDAYIPKTSAMPQFLEDFSKFSNSFDQNSVIGHPISSLLQTNLDNNVANAYFLPQLSQIESSDSFGLKLEKQDHDERNRKEEINGSLMNFSGQFDDFQYGQQMLINSRLGLQ